MNIAIIPAAGAGARFGGEIPKQFIEIAGAPILVHTIRRFIDCEQIGAVIVALPVALIEEFRAKIESYRFPKPIHLIAGGKERSDSILNALEAAAGMNPEIVAVHDAVRPFVTSGQISEVIERAKASGAAILALPATDTIKEVEEGIIVRTIDRRRIYRAQTPQAFRFDLLRKANSEAARAGLPSALTTDDSLLLERLGIPVAVVEGSINNIKITTPEDITLAERLFERQNIAQDSGLGTQDFAYRIGIGNDIHRLVEGRKLILGGVEIPFDRGLLGHSDGDSLSHSITDAILGAAGLGDIGSHFSDKDPNWKNADSKLFLRHACELIRERGCRIVNIDATIQAERPKLAPHIPAMKSALAEAMGIDRSRINIKAKTNEGLDAIGRGEAIAAAAIALLAGGTG